MFTEQDFVAYFSQIEELETTMRDTYHAAASLISDPKTKTIFISLSREENIHANLIDEVKQIAIMKGIHPTKSGKSTTAR